jgi:hypothetical protein
MSKFVKLAKTKVQSDATRRFSLLSISLDPEGELSPVMIGKPATEANTHYFNAMLKLSANMARRVAGGAKMKASMLKKNRDDDRILYPAHVIVDWENVFDDEGKPVKFSKEDLVDFFGALDDWQFDEVRNFFGASENFSGVLEAPTADDVEATAKN